MTYRSKRKPRKHQAVALKLIADKDAFALLMAMRVGKSKVIVDNFGKLLDTSDLRSTIIIAPAGAYRTWETAFEEDLPAELHRCTMFYTWSSDDRKKDGLLEFLNYDGPRVLLMNVEALSRTIAARELCEQFIAQAPTMGVVDEVVCIKNPKAKRTKYINNTLAPEFVCRYILSGLPTPKSPLDLYSEFEFLDPAILGFADYDQFFHHHAITRRIKVGKRKVPIVVGYKNVEELNAKIAPFSYRVRLEDCYDLPPSTYVKREVELTEEQARIYGDLKKYATAQLAKEKHVTVTQVMTQMLRLHQVLCGHSMDDEGEVHLIPERRTETLLDLLEDIDGKVIVWCSYDLDVKKVSAAIAKRFKCGVARFWGGNRDTREDEELAFKTDPDCRYMVATAAAGGRGRTWDVADTVIYFSNSYDLDHRMQSEERPKGVGKTKSIAYIDLVVPKSVDEKIIGALRDKLDLASVVTGDAWREWLV